mmetsp:Transcript_80867/g.143222  ORF Transcript_80867/g.143222 Transcript_80867/m.143222 type:complete len:114 (-) Transcript_80867:60-401(-)
MYGLVSLSPAEKAAVFCTLARRAPAVCNKACCSEIECSSLQPLSEADSTPDAVWQDWPAHAARQERRIRHQSLAIKGNQQEEQWVSIELSLTQKCPSPPLLQAQLDTKMLEFQ